ncbi:MAG: class I SAM-dependent methyltransferase [Deltaproteobacteria bacterium]|nr:class I SAM-dependent methyltransferase [Deltaproteobacteria bacterium]MBI3391494.1 class I SAM-dependent methyltransferase [Deltaproteobacteria bacterium]
MSHSDESQGGIFTGERLVAGDPLFAADFARHIVAYRFAQEQVRGKTVLDAGCGDGYGTHLLAQTALRAIGVDRSADTIAVAARRYQAPNLMYRACELQRLSVLGEHFDVVCNFQVIEHLDDPRPFLEQARHVLQSDGRLIVITPNRLNSFVENPYHLHEYVADELATLLRATFAQVDMHGVCGNEKVMAFERARGVQAGKILRLDPLGLRRVLPQALIEWVYPKLARLVRQNIARADGATDAIGIDDFHISTNPEGSLDLLAICQA